MQTQRIPKLGQEYTYDEVDGFYDHDASDLHWVLFKSSRVVALRLRHDYNMRILDTPAQVWVGNDSPTKEWGNTLANDTVQVPVYVKLAGRDHYQYLGPHEILTRDATDTELAEARGRVPHYRGVSRIVFLKKA